MRRGFVTLAMVLGTMYSYGQGTIKGKLIDSISKQPIGLATISLFQAADTVLITYRLSTPEGEFRVPGIPFGVECRIVVSFSGYRVFRKEFQLSNSQPALDLGTIILPPDAKSLDEVLVIAERPPVVIKKDTIEFNASAFKTLPNALLEDLLKKLPGVMVDANGNITVNGKPVNRILVDGKSFFGDDPKMATQNLPANIIDKVQVADDKDELLRNGDDNVNNIGKVVNITLKKAIKRGWFGKLYAGGGTESRYEVGGIANIFRDTLQFSVLGYMNNLNRPGFSYSDLQSAGGFSRSSSNSLGNSISVNNNPNGGGININGINFGGSGGNGVATSKGVGFNINHAPNLKRSFFAQYFFGNVVTDRQNYTNNKQFNSDTVISNTTLMNGDIITNAHNFGIGARLKPDSVTNFLANASMTIGNSDDGRLSTIYSENNILGALSNGKVNQDNTNQLYVLKEGFSYTRLSKKKAGRRFTIGHGLTANNQDNYYTTLSDLQFLYPNVYDSVAAQLRKERIPRTDAYLTFNYSDPLAKRITLRLTGRYELSELNNKVNTFNQDSHKEFTVLNDPLSSNFKRLSNRYLFTPGIEFKWKNVFITPAVKALLQYVNNDLASLSNPLIQRQNDLLPQLTVVWQQLNFNYNRDIILPGYQYLLPVVNNTNPYYIIEGNTALVPSRQDNFSVNYYYNSPKHMLNAGGWISSAFTHNDIIQSITINNKGIQTTRPVNANGTKNYSMNVNVNKQYKNKANFIFAWNTGNYANYTIGKLIFNGIDTKQTTVVYNHWLGFTLNFNDKFEWNNSYSIGLNFTRYNSPELKPQDIVGHRLYTEVVIRWIKHVILETQFNYGFNSSIPPGASKDFKLWNAAINFTMLKDERGVLKFSAFDLLHQNNIVNISANRNSVTTTQTNVLPQYFMTTFTYNMRVKGASKKVGGRLLLF